MTQPLSSRNWFGKASAGLILGLAIALGVSGLLAAAMDLKESPFSLQGQFTMWLMSPVWCLVLSFCFLFRDARHAWGILGLAAGAVWLALYLLGRLA